MKESSSHHHGMVITDRIIWGLHSHHWYSYGHLDSHHWYSHTQRSLQGGKPFMTETVVLTWSSPRSQGHRSVKHAVWVHSSSARGQASADWDTVNKSHCVAFHAVNLPPLAHTLAWTDILTYIHLPVSSNPSYVSMQKGTQSREGGLYVLLINHMMTQFCFACTQLMIPFTSSSRFSKKSIVDGMNASRSDNVSR